MISRKITPDAGQARTMADYQQLLDETGRQVEARAALARRPMYVSYYGYSMEYWPHNGQVNVNAGDTESGYIPLDEKVAGQLGIPYDDLMAELQSA